MEKGDLAATEDVLSRGSQGVNVVHGPLRVTVLHIASFLHPDLAPVLINHGADVRAVDKLGKFHFYTKDNCSVVSNLHIFLYIRYKLNIVLMF